VGMLPGQGQLLSLWYEKLTVPSMSMCSNRCSQVLAAGGQS
jgi:hypothetical protein